MLLLCADSSPFFHPRISAQWLPWLAAELQRRGITQMAYFGGANGFLPEFVELAEAIAGALALPAFWSAQEASTNDNSRIPGAIISTPTLSISTPEPSASTLEPSASTLGPQLVLLAGGSVSQGWKHLDAPDTKLWLMQQQHSGAVFIGISAGAIHLSSGLDDEGRYNNYLGWAKVAVAVHEEQVGWPSLPVLSAAQENTVLGIPMGEVVFIETEKAKPACLQGKAFSQRNHSLRDYSQRNPSRRNPSQRYCGREPLPLFFT